MRSGIIILDKLTLGNAIPGSSTLTFSNGAIPSDIIVVISLFLHPSIGGKIDIQGLGSFRVDGTVYMPQGLFQAKGAATREVGRLIADTVDLRGDSRLILTGAEVFLEEAVFLVQ